MRVINCEQGTEEWLQARCGVPSASMYSRIVTTKGEWSKSAEGYIDQLIMEKLTGQPTKFEQNEWMLRGTELEPEARNFYSFITDQDVTEVGFCLHDTLATGASPDGLVGEDGGLEIKCPMPETHLKTLKAQVIPSKYYAQVMGNLWITGRKWWDFMSYCPEEDFFITRIERDEDYIAKLEEHLTRVVALIEEGVQAF